MGLTRRRPRARTCNWPQQRCERGASGVARLAPPRLPRLAPKTAGLLGPRPQPLQPPAGGHACHGAADHAIAHDVNANWFAMAPRGVSLAVPLLLAPLALEPHLCVAQTILGLISSGAKQPPIGFMLAAHAEWLQRQAALFCCVSSCSRLLLHFGKSAPSNVQRQQLACYVASLPPQVQTAPRRRAAPNVRQGVNGYLSLALPLAHAAALAVPPSHH